MASTRESLEAVLDAARRVLAARDDQMLTSQEWDDLRHAVAACAEPPAAERDESFCIDASGALVRCVVPLRGEPYEHRCTRESFEAVAHAVADAKTRFTLEDLRAAAGVTWTQAAVAFAFLKERGVVVPAGNRHHSPSGFDAYLDAMTEYHALREKGPQSAARA